MSKTTEAPFIFQKAMAAIEVYPQLGDLFRMTDSHIILCDEVADILRAKAGESYAAVDFPNVAPPFEHIFLEWTIREGERMGVFVEADKAPWNGKIVAEDGRVVALVDKGGWALRLIPFAWSRFAGNGGRYAIPIGELLIGVRPDGTPIEDDIGSVSFSWKTEIVNDGGSVMKSAIGYALPTALMALTFMHTRNTKIASVEKRPPRYERRRAAREHST